MRRTARRFSACRVCLFHHGDVVPTVRFERTPCTVWTCCLCQLGYVGVGAGREDRTRLGLPVEQVRSPDRSPRRGAGGRDRTFVLRFKAARPAAGRLRRVVAADGVEPSRSGLWGPPSSEKRSGCGGVTCTRDLLVMGQASCCCSTPRQVTPSDAGPRPLGAGRGPPAFGWSGDRESHPDLEDGVLAFCC